MVKLIQMKMILMDGILENIKYCNYFNEYERAIKLFLFGIICHKIISRLAICLTKVALTALPNASKIRVTERGYPSAV